jgi:acyl transferase domain-containing protein/NADPH:quinone reductase-like Zn-dependent oxidoreductase/phospholipid N-methyltransferase
LTGTNGHTNGVVNGTPDNTPRFFTLSARSEHSILNGIQNLKAYLEHNPQLNLNDLSYTLTARRSNFSWRSSFISEDIEGLLDGLTSKGLAPVRIPAQVGTVFVFTGQGAQWAQMGYHLVDTDSAFARSIHRSDQLLKGLGAQWSLVEELSKDPESTKLNDSTFGQPASTAVQIALIDLLSQWKVHPTAVIGHSSGEIAAAYAAGAITHEAAISASYHRSFLAAASKKLAMEAGAMMAVGLGEEAVMGYIDKLSSSKVVVACVNSPSSTTISGDAPAVLELKKALEKDSIFARLLKVDTAYHSHHMDMVGDQYLRCLADLGSGPVQASTRFFSTVTGKEKQDGFGAHYWVENLVSQVRFSIAIQLLSQELGLSTLNLVEIGPHKALAGPIRQSLDSLQGKGTSYSYIPTLVRGDNDVRSLMNTGSALFRAGSEIDTSAVASLGISKAKPKVLNDLPPYHWNHTKIHWAESRLSRDYRHRRHPHHELLGSRVLTSPDHQPSWRVLIGVDNLPWLKHHAVDGSVVFPGAGYIAMAIQAAEQLKKDQFSELIVDGYRLRNISFKKPLYLSNDSNRVEVVLNFRQSAFSDYTYDFSVSSISEQGGWLENCDGAISLVPKTGERRIDAHLETTLSEFETVSESGVEILDHKDLYAGLASKGNQFGPTFAVVDRARLSGSSSLSDVTIPDIIATMPGQFMHPLVIQPALYDALMHTCVYHFQQRATPGSTMPTFYSETFISADIVNQPGKQLQVLAELANTSSNFTNFNVSVFQRDSDGRRRPVMTVTNGEFRIVGASVQSSRESDTNNIFKVEWGLDASSVTADLLESLETPLQCTEAGMSQAEKIAALHSACTRYMERAVKEIEKRGLTVPDDHRANLFRWILQFINREDGRALLQNSPQSDEELLQQLSKLGVEGELVARFGPKMTELISGEMDGLALFLEGNLLYRVYHTDDSGRGNRYMAEYAKKVTFQNNGMRILEIGAGTGGATLQVLRACSPNGERFCSEYMYTDISSGFFETARTTIVKDWAHLLTFQTLDLENDPTEQKLEEHAYDLIIASNVVHATKSLSRSLEHIHKLLKPGGILGLVELIKETPYHNMTFGLLSGWWLGVHEGRETTPLQTVAQWDEHLKTTSFSGVDLAACDFPEPAQGAAFFTSTAIRRPTTNGQTTNGNGTNGHGLPRVEILNVMPEEQNISTEILDGLDSRGFRASIRQWSDDEVDSSTSYIVLDSVSSLLLNKASPTEFSHITSLLSRGSKVYWISFANGQVDIVPDTSLVTGLARSARNENGNLKFLTLDVQDELSAHKDDIIGRVIEFIQSSERKIANDSFLELDTMYRGGKAHIQRLVSDAKLKQIVNANAGPAAEEDCVFHQDERVLKATVEKPGLLNSLTFVDDETVDLGADEIEVESRAWGVNMKDVTYALGKTKPSATMFGEGAGIVTRLGANMESRYKVGDRVAVLFGTPFANRTRTNGQFASPMPDSMSFEVAAAIPVAFMSAYYALVDTAGLTRGQTILIHSATSDVGRAAIQLARRTGATIFATVNDESKRQVLTSEYAIAEDHIFSDQAADFAGAIMRLTSGQGVDVVLNTLTGDGLHASLECLAKLGTFIEMGPSDSYRRNHVSMEAFDKNIRFASIDISVLAQARPERAQDLLQRAFHAVETESFASPVTTLPINEIEKAFRLVQSEKESNKVVLTSDASTTVTAKAQRLHLRSDKTYVIVGGLGTLGRHLCSHLQNAGARNIAIVSRQPLDHETRASLEGTLVKYPESVVKVFTADVADWPSASKLLKQLTGAMPPVTGLLHGAMVLSVSPAGL